MRSIDEFLDYLKNEIESVKVEPKYLVTGSSNNGFERLVADVLKNMGMINKTPSVESVCAILHFGHHFPDITIYLGNGSRILKYGVELKSTQGNTWTINGGSFFESVSDPDYEEIYVLFGKIKKGKEEHYSVRFKPYWESLVDIVVTHSPRYLIDLDNHKSIFHSLVEYQMVRNLSKPDKTKWVQKYLQENAGGGTWYLPDQIPPQDFSNLSSQQKQKLISEAYILFPADLLKPRSANYQKISAFWLEQYYVYTTNIRDKFSASGKKTLHGVLVPHTIFALANSSELIKERISLASKEFSNFMRKQWHDIPHKHCDDLLSEYASVLDKIASQYGYSDLFKKAGLSFSEGVLNNGPHK